MRINFQRLRSIIAEALKNASRCPRQTADHTQAWDPIDEVDEVHKLVDELAIESLARR